MSAPDPSAPAVPGIEQNVSASDRTQQAILAQGTQNVFLAGGVPVDEAAFSLAPPLGRRDDRYPLRGRDQLIAELTRACDGNGPRVHVLYGLGGCGKTSIALEIAQGATAAGVQVWWMTATDADRLVTSMRALARRLGLSKEDLGRGDVCDLMWQLLAARSERWLLIVDNADDVAVLQIGTAALLEGTGWLRPLESATGMVLVTSRDGRQAGWGSWCHLHRVEALPDEQGARVLLDLAGEQAGEQDDAAALSRRLGGLPLALRIAGSYLAETLQVPAVFAIDEATRSFAAYRTVLERGQTQIAFPVPAAGGGLSQEQARELIGLTWELSLDLLEGRGLTHARPLLQLLASFADAAIPYELLLDSSTLADSSPLAGITGQAIWQTLQALADAGLVDLTPARHDDQPQHAVPALVRLHPLVRDTSQPQDEQAQANLALTAALLAKAASSPDAESPENPSTWDLWQSLTPHILHLLDLPTLQSQLSLESRTCAAQTAHSSARYLSATGAYQQAETRHRQILAIQQVLGADHPDTLTTRYEIAHAMSRQGRYADAETELREILAARLQVLGADHPDTLTARHEIARTMTGQGRYANAESELREVLTAEERVLGADHPDTLATRHEIAGAMGGQGRYADAESELREILTAAARVLGTDHPHTLAARQSIADAIAAQGRHADAESEYRALLGAVTRVLGAGHPSTLITRHEIARTIAGQGRYADAETELREILAARLQVLGADHPDTLATRHEIARTMANQGRYADAESELRAVLTAKSQVLGADHPSTLATRYEIANAMAEQGRYAAAHTEIRAVLTARMRVLGADHPSTLDTQRTLRIWTEQASDPT